MPELRFHYTNKSGFNGIRSAPTWRFRVSQPPGEHPAGAYFTDYDESTPNLASKLRIPKSKIAHIFAFADAADLRSIEGGRGQHIFYSPGEYNVGQARQDRHGATSL